MTVFEVILVVGMVASICATIAQMYGKKKIAGILTAVASGIDRAKPIVADAAGDKGYKARKAMTDMIQLEAKSMGKLDDLNDFLEEKGLNK